VTQQTAGTHFLDLILELFQQVVEVILGAGLFDRVERLVDLVEVAPHLPVLVVEFLAGFFETLGHHFLRVDN
jgi:hypothetical protein